MYDRLREIREKRRGIFSLGVLGTIGMAGGLVASLVVLPVILRRLVQKNQVPERMKAAEEAGTVDRAGGSSRRRGAGARLHEP
jgi:hypothetical protein